MYDLNYMTFWKRQKTTEAVKRSVVSRVWGRVWCIGKYRGFLEHQKCSV